MAIDTSLQAVNKLLLSITDSSIPLLRDTTSHILGAGGKRLRPRLVLLAHDAVGGTDVDYVIPLAAATEIIHTATLVHDDINDHGTLRRGHETVNSRWGGTFALLTGDFMFTKTYEIMAPYPPELNATLAQAAIALVEGETLQIHAARQGTLDYDTYFEIIAKKTAALFVACVEMGALAAHAPIEWLNALRNYAFNLGLAFQITDDVLDLIADPATLGKNAGIDLGQGRGIAAVQEGNHKGNNTPPAAVAHAPDSVHTPSTAPAPFKDTIQPELNLEDAVARGRKKAQELARLARESLHPLPASAARDALRDLARQIVERQQ